METSKTRFINMKQKIANNVHIIIIIIIISINTNINININT